MAYLTDWIISPSQSSTGMRKVPYKYLFLVKIHLFWNSYGIEKCWTKSSIIFAWSRKRLYFRVKTHQFGVFCSILGNHIVHYQIWTIWNYHFGTFCSVLSNRFVHYADWMIWMYEMAQIFHIWTPKMFIDYSSELDPDSGFHSFLHMENNIIKEERKENNHWNKRTQGSLS